MSTLNTRGVLDAPRNLEAEAAVIGAMLTEGPLSQEAIRRCKPSDFYCEAYSYAAKLKSMGASPKSAFDGDKGRALLSLALSCACKDRDSLIANISELKALKGKRLEIHPIATHFEVPHSRNMEMAAIGKMLLSDNGSLKDVVSSFKEDYFFESFLRRVFVQLVKISQSDGADGRQYAVIVSEQMRMDTPQRLVLLDCVDMAFDIDDVDVLVYWLARMHRARLCHTCAAKLVGLASDIPVSDEEYEGCVKRIVAEIKGL